MAESDLIKLPKNTVLGSKKYGGYVYNIDCQFGGTGGSSSLTLSIVSEDGTYIVPTVNVGNLDSTSPISISEDLAFHGALVSYELSKKAEQKVLTVKYIDGSFILDRWFVGLHKRHGVNRQKLPSLKGEATGWASKPSPSVDGLIIVGKEYHPCDTDFDSLVDFTEGGDKVDWCDPCPFCPPEKYKNTCMDNSDRKIFPTKYTFNELIVKMTEIGITLVDYEGIRDDENIPKIPNTFIGSLRKVLQDWCSELGYGFYWNYKTNALHFIDLKIPLNLDFSKYKDNLTDYNESVSIENTQSRGAISYYEREGTSENYSCEDSNILTLTPFFYGDLRGKDLKKDGGLISTGNITSTIALPSNSDSKKTEEDFSIYLASKEISIGLSYYSQSLREAYWFYNFYKVTNWSRAWDLRSIDVIDPDTQRPSICSSEYKEGSYSLDELGMMKILDVIAPGVEGDPWNVRDFPAFLSILPEEKRKEIRAAQQKSKDLNNPLYQYYFIVVDSSLELIAKQYEVESSLAESFMGKFWYRKFTPIIGGGADNARKIEVHAPDAEAKFYEGGSGFQGHPICSFGYEEGSYLDKLLKEVGDNKKIDSYKAQFIVSPKISEGGKLIPQDPIEKSYKISSNMVIAQRDAKWYPNKNQIDQYKDSFDYYRNEMGMFLLGSDGRPDLLTRRYPCAKDNKKIRVYCVRCARSKEEMVDGLPISISTTENFVEVEDMTELRRTSRLSEDKDEPYSTYKLVGKTGLSSRVSQWIKFDGFSFMMPVGGALLQEGMLDSAKKTLGLQLQEDTESFRRIMANSFAGIADEETNHKSQETTWKDARYRVLITQAYSVPRYIDKYQNVYKTAVKKYGAKHDYYYHLLDDIVNELKVGQCLPDPGSLQEAHDSIAEYMMKENLNPHQTLGFTVLGVFPISIEIGEGLDSFTITLGDNGPSTTYTLSSKYAEVPEGSIFDKFIQQLGYKLLGKSIGGQGLDSSYKSSYIPIH